MRSLLKFERLIIVLAVVSSAFLHGQRLDPLLNGTGSRHPGSPGNLLLEKRISTLFSRSGLEHGEMLFRVPCFVPGKTLIEVNRKSIEIHPMRPGAFVLATFWRVSFRRPLCWVLATRRLLPPLKALTWMVRLSSWVCKWRRLAGVLRFGVIGFIFWIIPSLPTMTQS